MPERQIAGSGKHHFSPIAIAARVQSLIDTISNPVLALNQQGLVTLKNLAFSQYLPKLSENIEDNANLSAFLASATTEDHKALKAPYSEELSYCRASVKDDRGAIHWFSVYPEIIHNKTLFVFEHNDHEEVLKGVLDCIPARVFWKDINGDYLGSNHLFQSDCGFDSQKDMIGKNDYDVFPKEEADNYVADDQQVMREGIPKLNIEEPQTQADGKVIWLQTNKVPIRNKSNQIIGVMGSYSDITERRTYQALIEKQARYDQLTGLFNRQALQAYFNEFQLKNDHQYGGLLFIDLDKFKAVNDTLGHAVGDSLLMMVSERICETCSEADFLVRLGGDEFAIVSHSSIDGVITPEYKIDTQNKMLELARSIKNTILKPYLVGSHYIQLGVSLGVTFFDSENIDWANTFNEADMAMYDAKFSGSNIIRVFSEEIRENTNTLHQMRALLNQAIEKNELYLNVQPQYGTNNQLIGAEALLRWKNSVLGEVSPMDFIPVSEQSGTIHTIGLWVFEEAFRLVQQWSEAYGEENIPPLAVNVSAKQFQSSEFLSNVQIILQEYKINPKLIHFELTESLLVENEENAIEKLKALSELGFPLAIDDFGTGYSCLSYLNQLPIDKIKIDKSFTFQVIEDKKQAALVNVIISMAKSLDMTVIAEGVETKEQLDFLKIHGCYEYQGYYFSRPLSVHDYENILQTDPTALNKKN